MAVPNKIVRFFDSGPFIRLCKEEFEELTRCIIVDMQTKAFNSGAQVNSLKLPEEASGATAASLKTEVSVHGVVTDITYYGRKGIKSIDDGSSPADIHQEFGSFDSFYQSIKVWARAKEARWGLPFKHINEFRVAKNVWEKGTILFRQGGGTDFLRSKLNPTIDRINTKSTSILDKTIFTLLDSIIEL